jgi:hypothetical protein
MGSEKKDFLISQAKMAGKNMAQFIADLSAQDNLQERQERQIKRHNEALYFVTKSLLVWEYYLLHDSNFEGQKIINHARHEAVKIYQSVIAFSPFHGFTIGWCLINLANYCQLPTEPT